MATVGAFSRHNHLDELDSPLVTNEGMLSPSARKQRVLGNLDITATPAEINAAADVSSKIVSIADAASYAVLVADSGKTHVLPDLTASITVTLPTASAGLEYRFIGKAIAADAQNWKFATTNGVFLGGVQFADTDEPASPALLTSVFPNGSSNDNMTYVTPSAGSYVHVICDGTNWIVNGVVYSATVPTFTDA